jgi:hypothetical protein
MYGLSEDVKLDFLRNRELIQMLVGQYQLILRFDGDISISIECEFDHIRDGQSQLHSDSLPLAATSLLELVGAKITAVDPIGSGALALRFSNNDILTIKDSNEDSESYEILGPNVQVVV